MAILKIAKIGHPILFKKTNEISKLDDIDLKEIVLNMSETMLDSSGIGLAAPQVGIQKQILVIDLDIENPTTPPLVLINPEIIGSSASIETYEEGCLSIPGVYLDVIRPSSIKLSFRDEMGRPKKMNADGLIARCIQHEMDHLNGVLFVDRVTSQEDLDRELNEHGFHKKDVVKIN